MEKKTGQKAPYMQPQIKRIELCAEEVLEVGCKTTVGGPAVLNPVGCVAPTVCAAEGS